MSPAFHSTPETMWDDISDQRWVFRWALPGSLVLHSLIAALVMFGLPTSLSRPQEEKAVTVDLVPPPPEKTEAEPSPPAQAPKSGKPQDANVEMPSPTSNAPARHGPSPVLRPVFQFGEKDGGPRASPDGNSTEDGSASPTAPGNRDKQNLAEPPAVAADGATSETPQPAAPQTQAPKPADAAKGQRPSKLQEAKTLFSATAAGTPIATTATGNVPRGVRVGRLCVTELREQLLHASPPFVPDLLPSEGLNEGTILEIPRTAFRAKGQWYDLGYRCEVDRDATKVVSFAFHVGEPVPRSEWKRRGLP